MTQEAQQLVDQLKAIHPERDLSSFPIHKEISIVSLRKLGKESLSQGNQAGLYSGEIDMAVQSQTASGYQLAEGL